MGSLDQGGDTSNQEEHLVRSLEQLYRFAGTVGTTLEAESVVDDALAPLLSLVAAQRGMIGLFDREGSGLSVVGASGCTVDDCKLNVAVEAVASLGSESVGLTTDDQIPSGFGGLGQCTPPPSALVPLWVHGRPIGIVLLGRDDTPFTHSELRLLDVAGRQLALAVENAHFFDDLQQSYRRLMDAQEELIRTERLAALGQLSATMAHEIRNPLATIFSAISQIRKHSQIEGDGATLLDIAEEEAMRLNGMVGGLLEFARPRAPRFHELRPAEVIQNLLRSKQSEGEIPEGVEVTFNPVDENIQARLDMDQFQRALHHILANAIAAVKPGEGKVNIRLEELPAEGGGIEVIFEDNGRGISQEAFGRIFEPFFSTKPAGTGLGLSVARRIAEDHGGTVEVSSEVGRGTTVRIVCKVGLAREDSQ